MVNCIQQKTDLSLIYSDVMLYCYRRAGKCSKADAGWTSFLNKTLNTMQLVSSYANC